MNNDQPRPTPRQTPGTGSGKEDYRRYAARKRRQRKQRRRILASAAVLAVLVLLIVLLVKGCSGGDTLAGTWDYDGITVYQFDDDGNGALILPSVTYDFSYQIEGDQLWIDFTNESVSDSIYTFSLDGDTLTLNGGEGTIGGTYELHRQEG